MRELLKALLTGESNGRTSDLLVRIFGFTGRTGFAWEAAQSVRVVIGPNPGCVLSSRSQWRELSSVSDTRASFVQRRMAVVGGDGFKATGGNLDLAVDEYLARNVNYLRVVHGVKLLPLE